MPREGWAESYYDSSYFTGEGRGGYHDYVASEAQHRRNARGRLALARRFGAEAPGLWVDLGCAVGFTLDETRRAGFSVLGVEMSSWAREVARVSLGLPVCPTLAEANREVSGKAAVLSIFQVLEHLPDPVSTLKEAHACLRPGGMLLIETWDRGSLIARLFGRRWQQITPPSVLWLLDRRSLTHTLESTGFRVDALLRTSKSVSVGWGLGVLAEKMPRMFAPFFRMLEHSAISKLGVRYRLGDLVTVVAVALDGSGDAL